MRLLNVHDLTFQTFPDTSVPRYIVASHRWSIREEAMIKDIAKKRNTHTSGYRKVEGYARYIRDNVVNINWLWIDTCCVNQESSQEVSEAVNSMFRWYSKAELCIAFLADVVTAQNLYEFERSCWFRRGWTLQELIAPLDIVFLTRDWQVIGYKGGGARKLLRGVNSSTGPALETNLATITQIPERILRNSWQSRLVDAEEIFRWMVNRETTKEEDLSYCLFGLFDVSLPLIYGEGGTKARERLLAEISSKGMPVLYDQRPVKAEMRLREAVKKARSSANTVHPGQHQLGSRSGSPKFKCPICPKSFNNKSELDQHRRDSHGSIFPFDCRSCKCTFKSVDARNQHMRDSHSLKIR